MAVARLQFEEHKDLDFRGWKLKNHPVFDPVDGRGVAHDLLEHRPGDRGTPLEEVSALGAFAFVRFESGLFRERYYGNRSDAQVLGQDIAGVFRDIFYSEMNDPQMEGAPTRSRSLEYEEYDQLFKEAIAEGYDFFKREVDAEENETTLAWAKSVFEGDGYLRLLTALRRGFRWATKRYDNNASQAAWLFRTIEQKVSEATKRAELGDELVVRYSVANSEVHVRHYEHNFASHY